MDALAAGLPAPRLTLLLRELLDEGRRVELPVSGSSMEPFIRAGDVLTLKPHTQPRLGDVVVQRLPEERLRIHRVVGRRSEGLLTRGDASRSCDPIGVSSDLLARVEGIERGGRRVGFGLGPERVALALLSRLGVLRPLASALRVLLRSASPAQGV